MLAVLASSGVARGDSPAVAAAQPSTGLLSSAAPVAEVRASFHEKTLPNGKKVFEANAGYKFVSRANGSVGIVDVAKQKEVGGGSASVTCDGCPDCHLVLKQGYAGCDGCDKCRATIVIKSGIAGAKIDEVITTDGKRQLRLGAGVTVSKVGKVGIVTVRDPVDAQKAKQYEVTCSGCATCEMNVSTGASGTSIGCSGCPDYGCTIDFKEVKSSKMSK